MTPDQSAESLLNQFRRAVAAELALLIVECGAVEDYLRRFSILPAKSILVTCLVSNSHDYFVAILKSLSYFVGTRSRICHQHCRQVTMFRADTSSKTVLPRRCRPCDAYLYAYSCSCLLAQRGL